MSDSDQPVEFNFQFHFPVNVTQLRRSYMDNAVSMERLKDVIATYGNESVDSVLVVAMSSPEGGRELNLKLAKARAASMKEYLEKACPELKDKIIVRAGISPWPDPSEGEDALNRLRYTEFSLIFHPGTVVIPSPEDAVYVIEDEPINIVDEDIPGMTDTLRVVIPEYNPPAPTDTVIKYPVTVAAIGTNLLFDAVTALNVELEIPIGDRFSLLVEDVFPWWEYGNKYCLEMWEMGGEIRYWFTPWEVLGTEKLRGFFAGVYGMSALFDFQLNTSITTQGKYWSTGITGGWSTTVGKKKWGLLELSLGAGYLYSDWWRYQPTDDYVKLIRDKYNYGKFTYWGLTRAKVSLVIPININVKRKEARYE